MKDLCTSDRPGDSVTDSSVGSDEENTTDLSPSSSGSVFCRICHQGDRSETLVQPCRCTGTLGSMHKSCIEQWLGVAGFDKCEICGHPFTTTRKFKPFSEWLFRPETPRDRRNLLADCLCFMILTPLAITSVWLCVLGITHFYRSNVTGYQWETIGLSILVVLLFIIYSTWCCVVARYHLHVFHQWRKNNQLVNMTLPSDANNHHEDEFDTITPDFNNNNIHNCFTTHSGYSTRSNIAMVTTVHETRTECRLLSTVSQVSSHGNRPGGLVCSVSSPSLVCVTSATQGHSELCEDQLNDSQVITVGTCCPGNSRTTWL